MFIEVPAEGIDSSYRHNHGQLIGAGILEENPDYDPSLVRGFQYERHKHTVYNFTKEYYVFCGGDVKYKGKYFTFENYHPLMLDVSIKPNDTGKERRIYAVVGITYNTPSVERHQEPCQYCMDHPDEALFEDEHFMYSPGKLLYNTVVFVQPPLGPEIEQ